MAYNPVQGAGNLAPDDIDEPDSMIQILHWIGFRTEPRRQSLIDDAFESYQDIRNLTEGDITTMASDFSGRTAANGRITFGTRRTKGLKSLTHWAQDFYRVSVEPSIAGLDEPGFKEQLDRATKRADIRKNLKAQTKTSAEAATPGPLESEKHWKQWEEKFINYTRCHIGVNGIPLSYVIRENDEPDHDTDYTDFVSRTVACAPLDGEYYTADRLTVFNMLVSFTTGQPSGDWIKSTLRYSDGRRSMNALRTHFAGEGNATRNMAEADRLHESLVYKNERALSFEIFLTRCQKMFNIYEKEGEQMTDDAKVRFLFKKIQHAGLRGTIDALKATQTTGADITYTMAANHLSTAVSELPEYIAKNRNILALGTLNDDKNDDAKGEGIYNSDGSIITGHIPGWRSLPFKAKKIVMAERKRLGIKYDASGDNKSGKGKGGRNGHNASATAQANRTKQLEQQNSKYKRQIKALKRQQAAEDDDSSDDEIDAGDQFGGKASKKKKKKQS